MVSRPVACRPRFGVSILLKCSLRLNAGIIKLAEFC
jgi:hypothetical protein